MRVSGGRFLSCICVRNRVAQDGRTLSRRAQQGKQ